MEKKTPKKLVVEERVNVYCIFVTEGGFLSLFRSRLDLTCVRDDLVYRKLRRQMN